MRDELAVRWTVEDLEKAARYVVQSGLFGVRDEVQAVALMLLAQAEGIHPIQAVREYHVIDGRPALRADAMLARFLAAGGRVEWHRLDDEAAEATFSHPQGGTVRLSWTLEDARRAGLLERRGSNWSRYPRAMLRARLISEGVRTVYPGVIAGIYTPEEVSEFAVAEPATVRGEALPPSRPEERGPSLPPPPFEPAGGAPEPVTPAQVQALSRLVAELGLSPAAAKEVASRVAGRGVKNAKDLTREEAQRLTVYLEGLLQGLSPLTPEDRGGALEVWLELHPQGLPTPEDLLLEEGA
ncbi:hypothetical protein Theos_1690 [Thermus oshimai JL-2]|uniref:RecT family n=1 Tax=Thermus oshimai JL-2 TaxID=751945 RepID=K7R713_THEOS|nr:hypothetical protein [Thermus oshimai]AFV76714.1 hypothetical protein Theos_1690 [Thermus oshimai JL-2]